MRERERETDAEKERERVEIYTVDMYREKVEDRKMMCVYVCVRGRGRDGKMEKDQRSKVVSSGTHH